MGFFHSPKCRLLSMLCLTFLFFLVEIIVGYFTNSTALIADSFHMLSDVVALVIAYVSVQMSPKKWSKNTFGWARAEVLGALINAVFLIALCFSIIIESLKRIVDPENLHNPLLILVVGIVGLAINVIGLGLFHDHGHTHGGHSHIPQQEEIIPVMNSDKGAVSNGEMINQDFIDPDKQPTKRYRSAGSMNMRGVFLHVLADALGSIIVIISALIVHYTDWSYNVYVDPILSIIMVSLIFYSTLPLLIDSALILLQTVPTHIQIDSLQRKLLEEIDGVLAVHEFHVWQLAGDRIIASAHIRCRIHSTTIQPEFVEQDDNFPTENIQDDHCSVENSHYKNEFNLKKRWFNDANCVLDCPPGQLGRGSCLQNTCCGPQQKRLPIISPEEFPKSTGNVI
ncbi:zinc transporter 1-like protein [Sarcoptes scabiei]|uniref:Zinc transporter 1-like protein n=1 Tax=Sarcoptes scabiei TaxID=52283 RepID=A0A132A548_SARSC|nr:zinc transporter 1-like protein [Sarcoptes scabiei]